MDFSPLQIAKLVLGYLKKEKCERAFDSFLESSPLLKPYVTSIKSSKYFVTRVAGSSLIDYLTEYARVYTIIQERLEASDYYNREHSKDLVDQLIYLLDNGRQTRQNTPIRSRSSTPFKEKSKDQERPCVPGNLSAISENVTPFDTETTPLKSLPGNSGNDYGETAKQKLPLARLRSPVSDLDDSDSGDSPDKSLEQDLSLQVLTQTLLEHRELHEKIAENINLVRNTSEIYAVSSTSVEERISSGAIQELDSAIKAIVQRTEEDPIFEKLISEIIGTANETTDEEQTDSWKNVDDVNSSKKGTSNQNLGLSTPVKLSEAEDESIRQRLRSSKKQDPATIDQHVNEAVQSIITASQSGECPVRDVQKHAPSTTTDIQLSGNNSTAPKVNITQNLSVSTSTGEILLYEGTFDNYVKASRAVNASNPLVLNNGLLMMQPPPTAVSSGVSDLLVDSSKPYYIWNGPQVVNVSVPQFKVNNLTEQDILTMPTVILRDNQQQIMAPQNVVVETYPTQPTKKKLVNIAPKQTKPAESAENLSEFITLYKCNDSSDDAVSLKVLDPKPQSTSKRISPNTASSQPATSIHIEILKPSAATVSGQVPSELKIEELKPEQNDDQKGESKLTPVTPTLKKESNSKTPKSGSLSHVRALDFNFNTPGKLRVSPSRRAGASSKAENRSPSKSSSAKISKTLFGTPAKNQKTAADLVDAPKKDLEDVKSEPIKKKIQVPRETNKREENRKRSASSWDSELRALAGPVPDRCSTPRRKRNNVRARRKIKNANAILTPVAQADSSPELTPDENKDTLNKTQTLTSDTKTKRRARIGVKSAISTNILKQTTSKDEYTETVKLEEASEKTEVTETAIVKFDNNAEIDLNPLVSDVPFSLINCNAPARYKRKCNIDNSVKKEVKITKVKEIKSLEFFTDGTNKLILSPSKLNASKRTLVEVDKKDGKEEVSAKIETVLKNGPRDCRDKIAIEGTSVKIEQKVPKLENRETKNIQPANVIEHQTNADDTKECTGAPLDSEANSSKFITPEMCKQPTVPYPVTARRNITPVLETPIKMDALAYPKTPGIFSPINNNDTPFTKVFKEQLQGVDISAIPTPRFPLTPNFPFTPVGDGRTPYSNRPTDYSTSSSYYQPSDTEQNKSLEQLIVECQRLENKEPTPVKTDEKENAGTPVKTSETEGQHIPPTLNVGIVEKSSDEPKELQDITKTPKEQHLTHMAIAEKMKSLSHNVIGRKNLSLVNNSPEDGSSSCSGNSSEDTSELSSDDDSDSDDGWNDGRVQKKDASANNSSRYNLRSRNIEISKSQVTESTKPKRNAQATSKAIQEIINETEIKATLDLEKPTPALSRQEKLLQEMEEKRKRMIAKFKDEEAVKVSPKNKPAKRVTLRDPVDKTACQQLKPSANQEVRNKPKCNKKGKNRRKSASPKKLVVNTANLVPSDDKSTLKTSDITEEGEGVTLHLSSDSEGANIQPFDIVETELLESSASSTPLFATEIQESHPLKTFHKALESFQTQKLRETQSNSVQKSAKLIKTNHAERREESSADQKRPELNETNKAEKQKESNSDLEAETLVKGLKEWGIYLVHNKSPKKQENVLKSKVALENKNETNVDFKPAERAEPVLNRDDSKGVSVCANSNPIKLTKGRLNDASTCQANSDKAEHIELGIGGSKTEEAVSKAAHTRKDSRITMQRLNGEESEKEKIENNEASHHASQDVNKKEVSQDVNKKEVSQDVNKKEVSQDVNKIEVSQDANKKEVSQDVNKKEVSQDVNKKEVSQDVSKKEVLQVVNKKEVSSRNPCPDTKIRVEENIQPCKSDILVQIGNTDEANISLEDGEIVSEDELEVPNVKTRSKEVYGRPLRKDTQVEKRNVASSSRSSARSRTSKSSSSRSSSGKSRYGELSSGKSHSNKSSSSKSSFSGPSRSKPRASHSKRQNFPSSRSSAKHTSPTTEHSEKIPQEAESSKNILDDLNLTDSIIEVTFDIRTFTEAEQIKVVHDDNKSPRKTLRDYDCQLLNKKISAKVYIESCDAEIEKDMSVTPFDVILDVPEGYVYKPPSSNVKILDCVTIPSDRKIKPLNVLYSQLMKDEVVNVKRNSPLDNLYEPQATNRYGKSGQREELCKTSPNRRKSFDQQIEGIKSISPALRYGRSKSVDSKTFLADEAADAKSSVSHKDEKSKPVSKVCPEGTRLSSRVSTRHASSSRRTRKSVAHSKQERKGESPGGASDFRKTKISRTQRVDACLEDNEVILPNIATPVENNRDSIRMKDLDIGGADKPVTTGAVNVTALNSDRTESGKTREDFNDDDLMNYAICGSERVENSPGEIAGTVGKASSSKRRACDEACGDQAKKVKTDSCQELLRNIDVDSFLKKIHGEV